MITRITKHEYPNIWDNITDEPFDESAHEHRRGSNYFVTYVYKIDGEVAPDNPELCGYWETDTLISDYEYGRDTDIVTLHRVEQREKIVTTKEWARV